LNAVLLGEVTGEESAAWKVEGKVASGYANWRVGGEVLLACADILAPLHEKTGLVANVRLELTPKSFKVELPSGD
jgi:hypothetical protein